MLHSRKHIPVLILVVVTASLTAIMFLSKPGPGTRIQTPGTQAAELLRMPNAGHLRI